MRSFFLMVLTLVGLSACTTRADHFQLDTHHAAIEHRIPEGGRDVIHFEMDSAGEVDLRTDARKCLGNTVLTLWAVHPHTGERSRPIDNDNYADSLCSRIHVKLAAGLYELEISGYAHRAVDYDFDGIIAFDGEGPAAYLGGYEAGGSDLFQVQHPGGVFDVQTASLTSTQSCRGLDTAIAVFNAKGQLMISDEDSGRGRCARAKMTLPAGKYAVLVDSPAGSAARYQFITQ